jgi:hypothetical protein
MGVKTNKRRYMQTRQRLGGGGLRGREEDEGDKKGERKVSCKKYEKNTKNHHEIPSIITFTQRTEKSTEEKKDFQS